MVKARKQVSQPVGPQRGEKSQGNYNIWYSKYSGERPGNHQKNQTSSRCCISKDAGETSGNTRDHAYICLKFARGCCPLGYECSWLHSLPTAKFNAKLDLTRDCFGRERHSEVRDDQSGVGSFSVDAETARTLYVGGIAVSPRNIQSVVEKHFREWGEIENMKVLAAKGVAFVRYKNRANAEFAREAMQQQTLGNREVLNVRWATMDPNPFVAKRKQKESERTLGAAVSKSLPEEGPWKDRYGGPTKKRHYGASRIQGEAVEAYPDTDHQYQEQQLVTSNSLLEVSEISGSLTTHTQPKTLSDLVEWSKKQASLSNACSERAQSCVPKATDSVQVDTQGTKNLKSMPSLVSAYSSSSEDETD